MTIIRSLSSFWQGNCNIFLFDTRSTYCASTWGCSPSVGSSGSFLWTTRNRHTISRILNRLTWILNNITQRSCISNCCNILLLGYWINYRILKSCLACKSLIVSRCSSEATCWINRFNCISRLVTYRIRPLCLFLGCIPYITKSWSSNSSCFHWSCPI